MKMREELELYKGKTAALEETLRARIEENTSIVEGLNTERRRLLAVVNSQYQMQIKDTKVVTDKALEDKTSSLKYAQDGRNELQNQLNNLQDILDVIPGVLTRKKEDGYGEHACHVRLASVLAQKFM